MIAFCDLKRHFHINARAGDVELIGQGDAFYRTVLCCSVQDIAFARSFFLCVVKRFGVEHGVHYQCQRWGHPAHRKGRHLAAGYRRRRRGGHGHCDSRTRAIPRGETVRSVSAEQPALSAKGTTCSFLEVAQGPRPQLPSIMGKREQSKNAQRHRLWRTVR